MAFRKGLDPLCGLYAPLLKFRAQAHIRIIGVNAGQMPSFAGIFTPLTIPQFSEVRFGVEVDVAPGMEVHVPGYGFKK